MKKRIIGVVLLFVLVLCASYSVKAASVIKGSSKVSEPVSAYSVKKNVSTWQLSATSTSYKKTNVAVLGSTGKKFVHVVVIRRGTFYIRCKIGSKWYAKKIVSLYDRKYQEELNMCTAMKPGLEGPMYIYVYKDKACRKLLRKAPCEAILNLPNGNYYTKVGTKKVQSTYKYLCLLEKGVLTTYELIMN